MFGPLEFPLPSSELQITHQKNQVFHEIQCIFCVKNFGFPNETEQCLSHIYEIHKLIIADVEQIADLPKYLMFWRSQFSNTDVKNYCSTMLVDVERDGILNKNEEFYLLSDILPMDRELRESLARDKLEEAIEQQKFEREDKNFNRGCLFCRNEIGPTRYEFLNHLSIKHNLQLGRPDNLVFIDKMIAVIENKLDNLQCIYCEKFFKDRSVLKEHMRKKIHKRINPRNSLYDQFYMVNYLEPNKSRKRGELEYSSDEECDWSDWKEDLELSLACLFCIKSTRSWQAVLCHMDTEHHFHFDKITNGLSFYDQVKLVNYIRRQIYKNKCIVCDIQKENNSELLDHMEDEKHLILPKKSLWNHPEYFFPTYENDAFLCQLDDIHDLEADLSNAVDEMSVNA